MERPDLRLVESNLIAVCRACHVVLDRAAGRARYWGW